MINCIGFVCAHQKICMMLIYLLSPLSSVPIHFFVVTNTESIPLVDRVMEQVIACLARGGGDEILSFVKS